MASGGKTPEQKISPEEIQYAQTAAARWNERIDDGFLEVEQQAVADAGMDHFNFIAGRNSAEMARAERVGYDQLRKGGGTANDLRDFGNTITAASTMSDVDSATRSQSLRDSRRLNVAKVGQDVALTASSGLANAAQQGNERALTTVQNKIAEGNAKVNAISDAVGGAVTGATLRADGYRLTKEGMQRTHNPGLRGTPLSEETLNSEDYQKKASNRIGWTSLMSGV